MTPLQSSSGRRVGRVAALWRYPVKSMAGETLQTVDLSWHGFAGDRRWAFIRDGMTRSGFPWLTQRELPAMALYRPRLLDPTCPDTSVTVVRTPAGAELEVADPELGRELGEGVQVIKQDRGVFDTLPLSLLTTASVAELGTLVGRPLEVQRFRPNLLIETVDGPFAEDAWGGRTVRVGSARIRVDKRDQRCVIVNLDPISLERDSSILRAIARERQACFGVYGSCVEPGSIAVGDDLVLE